MEDICEMPCWVFGYYDVQGNKIHVHRFLKPDDTRASDYQMDQLSEYEIFYVNLYALVHDKPNYYFYTSKVEEIGQIRPFLSRRKIIDYYDNLAKRVRSHDKNLDIRLLRRYVRGASEILRVLIDKGDSDEEFIAALTKGIQDEKARILALVDAILVRDFPLEWMIDNPGSQITASFNPIIEDPKLWYGAYYTHVPCVGCSFIPQAQKNGTCKHEDDERDESSE
jgi:hypothetical protein